MSIEAMKLALAVLEEIADEVSSPYDNKLGDTILALRAAIEEAEPVYEANEAFGKRQEWWNNKMFEMEAELQRYKKSAAMWRNKAYEAAGHPLPWEPDELWQGLTLFDKVLLRTTHAPMKELYYDKETDCSVCAEVVTDWENFFTDIEAKLKEKNG